MIERKKCPDCGGNLGKGATKCRCGWRGQTQPEESTESKPALVVDYGAIERERASYQRWVEAGSPTAAESIAKMRALMRKPKPTGRQHWERVLRTPNAPRRAQEHAKVALRRWAPKERIPGEDDDALDIAGQA